MSAQPMLGQRCQRGHFRHFERYTYCDGATLYAVMVVMALPCESRSVSLGQEGSVAAGCKRTGTLTHVQSWAADTCS